MKIIQYTVITLLSFLVIFLALPENVPVKFSVGAIKINFIMNPPIINTTLFGKEIKRDFKTKLGLDLQGGSSLTFEADTSKLKTEDITEALNSVRDIVERRVNMFGVSEPLVQTIKTGNKHRITVDIPGTPNVSDAVSLIGQTAQLSFKEEGTDSANVATNTPLIMRLTQDTGLTGKDVKRATVVFDQQGGRPQVQLRFNDVGAKLFENVTRKNLGKPVGIFLDFYPISAPIVQSVISGGDAVISGDFTLDQAKQLAIAINSGALPVPIKLVEQRTVGPSLGSIEIQKSIWAGVFGLLMVMFFMIMFYGRLGVISSFALIIYGIISFAIFRAIPVVLTLSGIAGFLLSIGMAVDSNILIFERIKEETRKGRDRDVAIRLGFGRAIDAIKDANITTLIVAFILYNPLSWDFLPTFGLIRGFALTLAIGVLTSLFTGITITRQLLRIFYRQKRN